MTPYSRTYALQAGRWIGQVDRRHKSKYLDGFHSESRFATDWFAADIREDAISSQSPNFNNSNIFETINPIKSKFEDQLRPSLLHFVGDLTLPYKLENRYDNIAALQTV